MSTTQHQPSPRRALQAEPTSGLFSRRTGLLALAGGLGLTGLGATEAMACGRSGSTRRTTQQSSGEYQPRRRAAASGSGQRAPRRAAGQGSQNAGAQNGGAQNALTQTRQSGTPLAAQQTPAEVSGGAALPLPRGSYRLSGRFGATGSWARYHTGQDLSAPAGTAVFAVVAGTVVASSAGAWAGIHVIVRAADGTHTLYAHLNSKQVNPGTTISAGQQIGRVGATGRAFGTHLHLEYYPQGIRPGDVYRAADPVPYLGGLGISL